MRAGWVLSRSCQISLRERERLVPSFISIDGRSQRVSITIRAHVLSGAYLDCLTMLPEYGLVELWVGTLHGIRVFIVALRASVPLKMKSKSVFKFEYP